MTTLAAIGPLLVASFAIQAAQERVSDDRLLQSVTDKIPHARVLSAAVGPSRRGGGRVACGLAQVGGIVEPFAVMALPPSQGREAPPVITSADQTPRGPAATVQAWRITAVIADDVAMAGSRPPDRADRNWDAWDRKLAIGICPDLRAPTGTVWVTEIEENPDQSPERRAWNRAVADSLASAIIGPAPPSSSE